MTQLLAFLFFTGLVGFFSWRATRKDDHASSSGYFLAGRSLSWIVIAGSLLLTNLSTEQLVGLNGGAFMNGMQVMAWEVWSSIAIVLMALVFLPRYLRGGVATVSQFLARRYSRGVGTLVSVLLLLSLLTNLLPFVLYSGALFMQEVFGVERLFGGSETSALWATVIALGVIGSCYAIFGGLKAVAVSDTLNGIGLLIGGLMIPFLALVTLGNEAGGGGGFTAGLTYLTQNQPERLSPIGAEDENIPFSTLFTGMLFIVTYYWCTNQAIVQRTFGSRSLAEGQKGVLFAAFMKLLGPLYLVLPGIIAYHLFCVYQDGDQKFVIDQLPVKPAIMATDSDGNAAVFEQDESGTVGGLDGLSFAELGSKVGESVETESGAFQINQIVEANTIVSMDESGKPRLIPGGDPDIHLPLNMADKSYGKLTTKLVPTWLLGFFAAVIFGAVLSSFNSGLNSAATLFSIDIYKGVFRPGATDKQMVRAGKVLGCIIAVGAISVAPLIDKAGGGLFDLMKNLAALYNIPLLAIVVVGIFSRRTPSIAAFLAVGIGFVFYLTFGLGFFGLLPKNTLFGVELHWLHIAGINFLILVAVMLVITAIRPREEAYTIAYSHDVDVTPWKGALPCGIGILILIGAMYFILGRFG